MTSGTCGRRHCRATMARMATTILRLAVTLVLLFAGAAAAQPAGSQSAIPDPRFDVISIRRNPSGTTQQSVNVTPTGVTFLNFPLRPIIQLTYGITQPVRIVGLPDWATDRYDVIARTETPVSPATIIGMRPMLRALLADRFKLSAKLDKQEMPAYALVLVRPDGKLGSDIKKSTVVCAGRGAPPPGGDRGDAGAGSSAQPAVPCGPRPGGPGRFVFVGSQLSLFAGVLSLSLGRTVIDRTGLTDLYDFEVNYAPENEPADTNRPSLFTALQEQLGVRLDAERELVEVLIVDRLERPTEN
jgi:uncharacterized protein (TIGR03435 family)